MNFAASMRGSHARSRSSHAGPEFIRTVHVAAAVPEYGQRNVNKAQAGFVIPTNCALRKWHVSCIGHMRRLLCRPLKNPILIAKR